MPVTIHILVLSDDYASQVAKILDLIFLGAIFQVTIPYFEKVNRCRGCL